MGYYEAGPQDDPTPLVLLHGWPELAFSWRHQIKAFAAAGRRVIAPDQRGYGATPGPEAVEAYDLDHLTGDIAHLLDALKIDKAIVVGHDWGGIVGWGFPLRHPTRAAGVVGVNTPHLPRPPADPIAILRRRFGDSMYIVRFQDPAREPDRIFAENVEKLFDFMLREPLPARGGPINLDFPSLVAAYDPARDSRARIASPEERAVFVETFRRTGFTGGINWYRNFSRNWERAAALQHGIGVPCLMISAELDAVLPPSMSAGMETMVPDLTRHLVKGSGHWTQQERPEEVSRVIVEWRNRRFP
jgi:microsomal epoxide hydrolase/non-specific protein-tyrosine kinase